MVIEWDKRHEIGTTHAPHTDQHSAPQSLVQSQGAERKGHESEQKIAWQVLRRHTAQVCDVSKLHARQHAQSGCASHYLQELRKPGIKCVVRLG